MEFEASDIYQVKLAVKDIVLWSPGAHFMHVRINIFYQHPSSHKNGFSVQCSVYSSHGMECQGSHRK